ncbi:sigma-54-dependent transcriptional regulator [Fusobacterium sp. PH5-44]|uniref:sigma-54-dependent transcriptional regulator n=1 Tax=unclassified Fusobacterium TaxID=2648384 RepID=UPI003D1FF8AF
MTLLGLKICDEIKNLLENDFENNLTFVDEIDDFLAHGRHRKFEAIVIEEKTLECEELIDIIKEIKNLQHKSIIIILGETSNLEMVAGCIKAGAYDYILMPESPDVLVEIIRKSVKDYKLLAEKVDKKKNYGDKLIGQSKEIVDMYKMIGKVSTTQIPVLVIGEKGTGKTSVAKSIHQISDSGHKPFISINCLSFPNELLERRIFGYEKGAFKEAVLSQIGDLEKANGGTLHLGNVEALSLDIQSKILYLLEEGKFYRMGSIKGIRTNIRIIATTSENLEEMINEGKFIDELYRKLRVLEINIPALRDRVEDIPLIIDHYLIECNEELNKNIKGVTKPALNKILRYDWPGNVNELKAAIKSSVALCRSSSIVLDDLPNTVLGRKQIKKKGDTQGSVLREWVKNELIFARSGSKNNYYSTVMAKIEKELIKHALEITNGKKVETAEMLGITRNTLRSKMNNYGLK